MMQHVSNQGFLLNVERFCGARYNDELSRWELEVSWQGLEDAENSYEGLEELFNDVPAKVAECVAESSSDGLRDAVAALQEREHPDYETVMLDATTAETGSIFKFVRHSPPNLHGWMTWNVMCNLALAFCESREARHFSNLEPISHETLRAGLDGVVVAVERSIVSEIPARFGIMLHSWTHASEHYLVVFACYEVNGCLKTPLLSMAPLLDALDEPLSAHGHLEFLATMLLRDYGVQLEQCRFLVADNCSVNRRRATIMGVALVGCASHRLNLGVQEGMASHEEVLAAVQTLMIKPRILIQSAKLRKVKNSTSACNSPGHALELHLRYANKRVCALYQELRDIESVAKALQGENVDLLNVREWFDELIAVKPQDARYLAPRASIVHSPDFESGCVRALRGKTHRLMRAEKTTLQPFETARPADDTVNAEEEDVPESFVERLRKRRRLAQDCVP
ncbi:GTP-dependent nucleic acid-binding protein engD [Phytophthora cinnamomi]|uniref:GTP-dependent nucleic acid-binding protein engD n=1 Tax=Phytophthora cinnamomi TaxID=4785 RepID=UPI00355A8EB7|nr:GTP-dependent nucleic acid-binding protein engD [Phytophthora cinnamomi]